MAPYHRSRSAHRHRPLADDLTPTGPPKTKSKKRKNGPEHEDGGYVDSRSSRKILKIGQDLIDEDQQDIVSAAPNPAFALESRFVGSSDSEEDQRGYDDEDAWGDGEEDVVDEMVWETAPF